MHAWSYIALSCDTPGCNQEELVIGASFFDCLLVAATYGWSFAEDESLQQYCPQCSSSIQPPARH